MSVSGITDDHIEKMCASFVGAVCMGYKITGTHEVEFLNSLLSGVSITQWKVANVGNLTVFAAVSNDSPYKQVAAHILTSTRKIDNILVLNNNGELLDVENPRMWCNFTGDCVDAADLAEYAKAMENLDSAIKNYKTGSVSHTILSKKEEEEIAHLKSAIFNLVFRKNGVTI